MYYNYLDRQKHYLRSFRTHNLWLNQYQTKMRTPRVQAFHITAFKRLAKSYSGVSHNPVNTDYSQNTNGHYYAHADGRRISPRLQNADCF